VKISRKQFLTQIEDLAAGFRAKIEAEVDGFDPDDEAARERRERVQGDYEYFARTYFPHYVTAEPSAFHRWLYAHFPELVAGRGKKTAIAAPRGEAKSTNITQIGVIWCLVTGRKRFVPIIMDAFEQAATMLEAIKAELTTNPRLLMDFPDATGQGRVWNAGVILTSDERKVMAFGSGKRMRGLRHGPHRPDLVVLDDIENDENVESPEQRDKLQRWLNRTVLKLGPPDDSLDVLYVGTILGPDSVLMRTLRNPLWVAHTFRALLSPPGRMDLWDRWEEILLNEGEDPARVYYAAHRKAMEDGAKVSWPSMRPLYTLMLLRARDGHHAFDSELQNDPTSEDNPFAEPGKIKFWVHVGHTWVYFGACDPSLGRLNRKRDPSAILVGGYAREIGKLHVVEAKIARRVPDKIISDIIEMQREYRCLRWAIEAVQFQEFLRTELVRRSAAQGVPVPAIGVVPHADKDLRIESLEPHIANGLILLHPSQQALITQLRHWPDDHDDGPDALHMLWMIAVAAGQPLEFASIGPARARIAADYLAG